MIIMRGGERFRVLGESFDGLPALIALDNFYAHGGVWIRAEDEARRVRATRRANRRSQR